MNSINPATNFGNDQSKRPESTTLSVIIPTLNEAELIGCTLARMQAMRSAGDEIIVVDGGSSDETISRARPYCDRIEVAPRGRARQMNLGAKSARGDILLFVHADTALPANARDAVVHALAASGRAWGRFDVAIDSPKCSVRLVAELMNLRSRWTGIATGDQAIFVRRADFDCGGGYPEIPIMEDIALSRCLKRISRPHCLWERVLTSGRRWERKGVLATIFLMWWLRLAYFYGADPTSLARRYGYGPDAPR